MSSTNKFILITLAGIVGLGVFIVAGVWITRELGNGEGRSAGDISTFGSCVDLARYVNENREDYYPPYFDRGLTDDIAPDAPGTGNDSSEQTQGGSGGSDFDYTDTNIQVAGVDEADVVKTNGNLLFILNDTNLVIYNVEDPLSPVKLSTTPVSGNPSQIFLYEDKVLVFGNNWTSTRFNDISVLSGGKTEVLTYNVSNPSEPDLVKEMVIQGDYQTSRMIDGKVYFISNSGFYDYDGDVRSEEIERYIPLIQDNTLDDYVKAAECNEVSYFGSSASGFVTVFAYDIDNLEYDSKVLLGSAYQTYMSNDNLYVVSVVNEVDGPVVDGPRPVDDLVLPRPTQPQDVTSSTDIFKFSIDGLDINFNAKGNIDGQLLNQFSMDEYDGYFRLATTVNNLSGTGPTTENHIYILDETLNEVGSIDNLGIDERIYSVRFMGETAYLVTFRQIDPFYAVDLSDPNDPKAVGELKLPGVSDYLHPYGEDYIVGVGRQAEERTGRIEGLKVALFNVSDLTDPVLIDEVEIGGQGSYTEVINDHKAFTFNQSEGVLVIPTIVYDSKQSIDPVEAEQNIISYLQSISGYGDYQITRSGPNITITFTNVTAGFIPQFEDWLFLHGSLYNIDLETTTSSTGQINLSVSMFVAEESNVSTFSWSGFSLIDISEGGLELADSIPFSGSQDIIYEYNAFSPRSILFGNDSVLMIKSGVLKTYSIADQLIKFSESI